MEYKSPAIHRTPLYRAKAAYSGMLKRCLNKDGKNPTYANVELRMTRDEWLAWALPEYIKFQTDNPDQQPHAARFHDSGHYELGNIRIISRNENSIEQRRLGVRDDGTKICTECKKSLPVAMFSRNKSRWNGLATSCKICSKKHSKAASERRSARRKAARLAKDRV